MNWLEMVQGSKDLSGVDVDRARVLDQARDEKLPVIEKESTTGMKPVAPVSFQPVHSPEIYESEFAAKGDDIIFHFWPWGYHKADRGGQPTPKFPRHFKHHLTEAMSDVFGAGRFHIEEDKDVGAIFVRCVGWGQNQFVRDLAIKACQKLHTALGGTEG